ncbi:MAG: hypothetical protein ACOCRK_05080 [bacterium]
MTDMNIELKINNNSSSSNDIIKITDDPILSWSLDDLVDITATDGVISSEDVVGQYGYEIRISNYDYRWGTNNFIGNKVNTGLVESSNYYWNYRGYPLERGEIYYGQIRFRWDNGNDSDWFKFVFEYNFLPKIIEGYLTPSSPDINSDLHLEYKYYDLDGDTEQNSLIRWYKNGVYQSQFDNYIHIKSEFLTYNDTWNVEIFPHDGYEFGKRFVTPMVKISKPLATISNIKVLPKDPNESDILKADYILSDISEKRDVEIRWYINEQLQNSVNDKVHVRLDVEPGDEVYYDVKLKDGHTYYSSDTVTIKQSSFSVYDIYVDGQEKPLNVSTTTPTISWKVHFPQDSSVNYTSIKIGTFYEADNIYSTTIVGDRRTFNIPFGILEEGRDYYISISSNAINEFDYYTTSYFRIEGSRWEQKVDNDTGYTIQSVIMVDFENGSDDETEEDEEENEGDRFNAIRIQDGNKFGEVRIYPEKIGFLSDKIVYSKDMDLSKLNILTIVGKKDVLKIYIDNECVIEGELSQETNEKKLEIRQGTSDKLDVLYKNIRYTVDGAYYPDTSKEYSNYKFHTLFNFENNECVSLKGYIDSKKVFGVNPDNNNDSSKIYSIINNDYYKATTVSKTFLPINSINTSPDGKYVVFAHSGGIIVMRGYVIDNYNYEINFEDEELLYPDDNGWQLVTNMKKDAAYFNSEGFNINTIDKNI